MTRSTCFPACSHQIYLIFLCKDSLKFAWYAEELLFSVSLLKNVAGFISFMLNDGQR